MDKSQITKLRNEIQKLRKNYASSWPQFGPGIPGCELTAKAAFNAALDQVDDILLKHIKDA